GRNAFVGPHFFTMSSSILKRTKLSERLRLEIRADASNLSNSVSFGAPTTDITSTTFGRIRNSTTSSSRKVQLGAKLYF
ncbi:MAG: hypothetical protein HYZ37_06630, partial [Candidatus Solibacter usitatus]|nr:hypothetical protein [Candidatus Solibacter usitatus]